MTDGDLTRAIAFCIGSSPGNSNFHFYEYDKALTEVIGINQRAFDTAIGDGERAVDGWTGVIPLAATVVIVCLVVGGMWPRLAEFR